MATATDDEVDIDAEAEAEKKRREQEEADAEIDDEDSQDAENAPTVEAPRGEKKRLPNYVLTPVYVPPKEEKPSTPEASDQSWVSRHELEIPTPTPESPTEPADIKTDEDTGTRYVEDQGVKIPHAELATPLDKEQFKPGDVQLPKETVSGQGAAVTVRRPTTGFAVADPDPDNPDYKTPLSPQEEQAFQYWVRDNKIPFDDSPTSDYDMRGFWKSAQEGDPDASTAVSKFDGRVHFNDKFKTPFHKTFSNESQYATADAPHWDGDRLIDNQGNVVADETPTVKKAIGLPPKVQRAQPVTPTQPSSVTGGQGFWGGDLTQGPGGTKQDGSEDRPFWPKSDKDVALLPPGVNYIDPHDQSVKVTPGTPAAAPAKAPGVGPMAPATEQAPGTGPTQPDTTKAPGVAPIQPAAPKPRASQFGLTPDEYKAAQEGPQQAPAGAAEPTAVSSTNPDGSTPPPVINAPNGQEPVAIIFHHTSGRGGPDGVRATLDERGLGVQLIVDRQGNIVQGGGNGRSQMLPGWGPKGQGLSNANTIGVEFIANDDGDITDAQKAAAQRLGLMYPNAKIYGHGEVNPGHKEADEGASTKAAAEAARAGGGQIAVTSDQNYVTGRATTFGYKDQGDPGVGTPKLGKLSTNNTDLIGLAIPEAALRAYVSAHPADWRKARVEVVTADGRSVMVPIVDLGPRDTSDQRGVVADFTQGLTNMLGNTGEQDYKFRIIANAGPDVTKNPQAFADEQAAIKAGLVKAPPLPGQKKGKLPNYVLTPVDQGTPAQQVAQDQANQFARQGQIDTLDELNRTTERPGDFWKTIQKPITGVAEPIRQAYAQDFKEEFTKYAQNFYGEKDPEKAFARGVADPNIGDFIQNFWNSALGTVGQVDVGLNKAAKDIDFNRLDQFARALHPESDGAGRAAFIKTITDIPNPTLRSQAIGKLLATMEPAKQGAFDVAALADSADRVADPKYQAQQTAEIAKKDAFVQHLFQADPAIRGTPGQWWSGTAGQLMTNTALAFLAPALRTNAFAAQIYGTTRDRIKAEHPEWTDDQVGAEAGKSTFAQLAPQEALTAASHGILGPILNWARNPIVRFGIGGGTHLALGAAGGAIMQAGANVAEGKDIGEGVPEAAKEGAIQAAPFAVHGAIESAVHPPPPRPTVPRGTTTIPEMTTESEAPPPPVVKSTGPRTSTLEQEQTQTQAPPVQHEAATVAPETMSDQNIEQRNIPTANPEAGMTEEEAHAYLDGVSNDIERRHQARASDMGLAPSDDHPQATVHSDLGDAGAPPPTSEAEARPTVSEAPGEPVPIDESHPGDLESAIKAEKTKAQLNKETLRSYRGETDEDLASAAATGDGLATRVLKERYPKKFPKAVQDILGAKSAEEAARQAHQQEIAAAAAAPEGQEHLLQAVVKAGGLPNALRLTQQAAKGETMTGEMARVYDAWKALSQDTKKRLARDGVTFNKLFRRDAVGLDTFRDNLAQHPDGFQYGDVGSMLANVEHALIQAEQGKRVFGTGPEGKMSVRQGPRGKGLSRDQAQAVADEIGRQLPNAPRITVVESRNELPAGLREQVQAAAGHANVEAIAHGNDIYAIASENHSAEGLTKALLEETIGHYGVENVLGDKFNGLVDLVNRSMRGTPEYEALRKLYGNDPRTLAAEYIAKLARGEIRNPTMWDHVKLWFNRLARALGFRQPFTDAELRSALSRSKEALSKGGDRSSLPVPRLSMAAHPESEFNLERQLIRAPRKRKPAVRRDTPMEFRFGGEPEGFRLEQEETGGAPKPKREPSTEPKPKQTDFNFSLRKRQAEEELTGYHGTQAEFDRFREHPQGIHFSSDPDTARIFATDRGGKGRVIKAQLDIKNPLRIEGDPGWHALRTAEWLDENGYGKPGEKGDLGSIQGRVFDAGQGHPFGSHEQEMAQARELTKVLKEHGHDGIVYTNKFEGKPVDTYVVHDPSQIRQLSPEARFSLRKREMEAESENMRPLGYKAAVRTPDGEVHTGRTHEHAWHAADKPREEGLQFGFADKAGKFVTMDEADRILTEKTAPLRSPLSTIPRFSLAEAESEAKPAEKEMVVRRPAKGEMKGANWIKSAYDSLSQNPHTAPLAVSVMHWVDRAHEIRAGLNKPIVKAFRDIKKSELRQVLSDFSKIQEARDNKQPVPTGLHPDAYKVLEAVKTSAKMSERLAIQNKVLVHDPRLIVGNDKGGYRPFRAVSDYVPRNVRREIIDIMRMRHSADALSINREASRSKNLGKWNDLVHEFIEKGYATNEAEVLDAIKGAANLDTKHVDKKLGNLEKARTHQLPSNMYEYSLTGMLDYNHRISDRMAEIEAFGQRGEMFQKALDRIHASPIAGTDQAKGLENYIQHLRNHILGLNETTSLGKAMSVWRSFATGMDLSGWMGMLQDAIGSSLTVPTHMGIWNTAKGYYHGLTHLKQMAHEAEDLGVIHDDMGRAVKEIDHDYQSGGFGDFMGRLGSSVAEKGLMVSGRTIQEKFIRTLTLSAAKTGLRDMVKTIRANPESARSRAWIHYMSRRGADVSKLVAEDGAGGAGSETDRFLRRTVADIQAGYDLIQRSPMQETTAGKFFGQYLSWATNQTRNVMREIVLPMFRPQQKTVTVEVNGRQYTVKDSRFAAVQRGLMLMAAGAATGMINDQNREFFLGRINSYRDLKQLAADIASNPNKSEVFMHAVMAGYNALLNGGMLGSVGNILQGAQDPLDRNRFKDPMHPTAMSKFDSLWAVIRRQAQEGQFNSHEVDALLKNWFGAYREGKPVVARALSTLGYAPNWVKEERTRESVAALRNTLKRFNDEQGLGIKPPPGMPAGGPDANRNTATAQMITDALYRGDGVKALKIQTDYLDTAPDAVTRAKMAKSLQSSIQSVAPLRLGSTSNKDFQEAFWNWARTAGNVPGYQLADFKNLVNTYNRAAYDAGFGRKLLQVEDEGPQTITERRGRTPIKEYLQQKIQEEQFKKELQTQ